MTKTLKIAMAQLNLTVGDLPLNVQKHRDAAIYARDQLKADIIVFPELSLTGYPPEDLLLRHEFLQQAQLALLQLIDEITGIYCLVGHPQQQEHHLYNACTLFYNGEIVTTYSKTQLPNYAVFDEVRYFRPCHVAVMVIIKEVPVGIVICEDLWTPEAVAEVAQKGAKLILSPNASPFESDKHERRLRVLQKRAQENNVSIVYVNHVGGQDEIVFDGGSMAIDNSGEISTLAPFFKEAIVACDFPLMPSKVIIPTTIERIYAALTLGLRDYVHKNHFKGVVLGLSGGIDSALTLTLAVDALGAEQVTALFMPSRYTAEISREDSYTLAKRLNVRIECLPIESLYDTTLTTLAPVFKQLSPDTTEENIQARLRAVLLMAYSNKFGPLVLSTGNRSELAVGYCTLYGDMAGGFAVLKDVYKTMVYELAHYRNRQEAIIPERILSRAPTAELAFNQKDEDTLPPYALLDQILKYYLNDNKDLSEIVALGFDKDIVKRIISLIHKNEYKRRQAALGPRINLKSFGKDWRYPLTKRIMD